MKNIGVFVNGFTSEYSLEIIEGISDFFKGKDVRLIFAQTRIPHSDLGIYEYQYWSTTSYLNNTEMDAIIVVCGEYTSHISIPKLSSALSNYKKIPVISIGQELFLAKNSFTHTDCKTAYQDVVSHLKNVHGCRRIAFFSANQTSSEEALERYEAYKHALKENQLFFNRTLVLNGNFTDTYAYDEILRKYKSKDDINFDAILCANDITAIGCQAALQRLGVKIPDDVKIIGFDDSVKAESVEPKLSTLNQNIYQQGTIAAEMAYNVVFGDSKTFTRTTKTYVSPIYRQSCGCIPLSTMDNVYKNQDGDICYKSNNIKKQNSNNNSYHYMDELKSIYNLYSLIHSGYTLKQFFYTLRYLLENASMTNIAVCFFDEPIKVKNTDEFELSRNMNISMLIDLDKNIEIFEPNLSFNPRKKIIHENFFDMEAGNYVFSPLFSAENNYGYIICKVKEFNFELYTVFMKILNSCITQAYEYTLISEHNQKLSEENILLYQNTRTYGTKSRLDSLTNFLNRRSFYEMGQQRIDMALDSNCSGLVINLDLDNMTTINEKYGTETGDFVIIALSTVIGRAFRANDLVGRLSGDKFSIIAIGPTTADFEKIHQKIDTECEIIADEKKFDFIPFCSVGVAEFNKINSKLKNLIEEADKAMYLEKEEKHMSGKLIPRDHIEQIDLSHFDSNNEEDNNSRLAEEFV